VSAPADARAPLRAWLRDGRLPVPGEVTAAALFDAARAQGLDGLLAESLAAPSAEAGAWPMELRRALADSHRRLLARGVRQLDRAARVAQCFEARGLRVLPLKGAALAELAYPSVACRPMADVDLLALDDWRASTRVLEEAGLPCVEKADHAWSYADGDTGGWVELHRSLTSCARVFPLDGEGLWSRARAGSGQVPRVPAPEDLLVQLAAHALFQHGGVLSLVQWLDFRRLLEVASPDTAGLSAIADDAGLGPCLAAALAAAHHVVGGPKLPLEARHLPRGVSRWLDGVAAAPLRAVKPAPASVARLRWSLATGRRATLVADTLLPPADDGARRGVGLAARRALHLARRWGPRRAS
jgi:hypothetical protein